MDNTKNRLTVFFENPFWVGVFEKYKNGKLKVAKVTFGAEPKDTEVYAFILKHYYDLRYSPALDAVIKEDAKKSETTAKRSKKADGGKRHRNKITAGTAIAARTEQNRTQGKKP